MQTTDRESTKNVETPNTTASPLPPKTEASPGSAAPGSAPGTATPPGGTPPGGTPPGEPRGEKAPREAKAMAKLKTVSGKVGNWLKTTSRKTGGWLKTASRKTGGWLKAAAPKKDGEAASTKTSGARKALSKRWDAIRPKLKLAFVDYPKRVYSRYQKKVPSKKTRQVIAGGAILVVAIASYFLWPGSDGALAPRPGMEFCEFLARPAAKLYIDEDLVTAQTPPIYRTELTLGKHTIRFVSPDEKTHEKEIDVVAGKRIRWFMSFVENRLYERAWTVKEEAK